MAIFAPVSAARNVKYSRAFAGSFSQLLTARVDGEFLGLPGNGRRIHVRVLHVFEFRDGLISRENVWLDGAAIIAQLTGG